jgi:hypothetical protein
VEVSFRRDGSSRFAKDARWGNFWSAGANWVVSNERFMKEINWVNYLKLRADYGEVGNDAGAGYYGYMALYSSTQNANQGAYWIGNLPNYDLKWETGQSWGIGIDGRLFNRLNFTIEYFDKRNKDLLFDVYNPLSAGATSTSSAVSTVTKNIGVISNKGVEISADVDVFKNRDWRINVGANITFLKNEVVKLPDQNKDGIISGTKRLWRARIATLSLSIHGKVSIQPTDCHFTNLTMRTISSQWTVIPMVAKRMPTEMQIRKSKMPILPV